jgi:hypothetical protein
MQPRDILIDGAVAQTAPLDLHVCIYMAGIISNEFPITHEGISRMASSPTEVAISERVTVRGSIADAAEDVAIRRGKAHHVIGAPPHESRSR